MTTRNLLVALLVAEIAIGAFVLKRSSATFSADVPVVNLEKLDPATADAITSLRTKATSGDVADWRNLAEALLGNGYYVAAADCFQEAAALAPNDLHLIYSRGFCLERVGQTERAIQLFEKTATESDTQLATTCWYQIGRCYLRQEDPVQAEEAFRRIPNFPPAAYQLSKLLIRSNRYHDAIEILDAQLEQLPNSLKLLQLRQNAAKAANDEETTRSLRDQEERAVYQLELEYSQRFITMFASRFGLPALLSRAMDLKSAGSIQQRERVLRQALDVIRTNKLWQYRSVLVAMAHVQFGLGNLDEVQQLVSEIRRTSQDGADLLELEGLVHASRGELDAAAKVWKRALDMQPSIGLIPDLLATGTLSEDEVSAYQAKQKSQMGLNAYRSNQIAEARVAFAEATKLDPKNSRAWFYLGETERLVGSLDNARAAYSNCLDLAPGHGRATVALERLPK
ncbi:tetratricopeptide repeat protein [Fuerstiella marisgermanici]|uniref:Cellulose synthase subunit n=1 Tax=Fuerstiella marisgermanici TaxID=1891926 RepID=A0A1P8WNN7_9PLAN|nr:tetratricopeptide repeat protein [Fuerstiella marisgermanici]APZ95670.1 cellulose synthase subunit [Fuerstiella marisgermanici]